MTDNNISACGLSITLVASKTFPQGFTFDAFPHDADPLDIDDMEVADSGMGLNGHMSHWKVFKARTVTLRGIASADAVESLYELLRVNRAAYNKQPVDDTISLTINYPNGFKASYSNGIIVSGTPHPSVSTEGYLKTPEFVFRFRDFEGHSQSV